MRLVGAGAAFVAGSLILQQVSIGLVSALLSLGLLAVGLSALRRELDAFREGNYVPIINKDC